VKPRRFRLRTILLIIATLAILMAVIPVSALSRLSRRVRVSVRVAGRDVAFHVQWDHEDFWNEDALTILDSELYVQIPIVGLAIVVGSVAATLTLAVYCLARWRKAQVLRTSPHGCRATAESTERPA
jgi:hypothetical protein